MKLLKSFAVAMALFSAAPANAQQVAVDGNFLMDGFTWDRGGRALIRWRPVLIDGKIAVCGVYAVQGGSRYINLTRQAMRNMRAKSVDGFFMPNMSFFRQVGSAAFAEQAMGQIANCRVSATEGSPEDLVGFALDLSVSKYR